MPTIPNRIRPASWSGAAIVVITSALLFGAGCSSSPQSPAASFTPTATTSNDGPPPTATGIAVSASPTPTPAGEPEPVRPAEDLLALQETLAATIENYHVPGLYAVAVTDLQTGEMISVNGEEPRLAGCVINLFVILQAARDIEAGKYPLQPADSLMAATTWSSNARTARDLFAIVGDGDATEGVRRVDTLIQEEMKLPDILIDHPPAYHAHSIDRDYNNWLTAEAVNLALAALWHGEILGEEWRERVLDHLATVSPGLNYLTAAVPEGIVSHKNGFLPADTGYVDNDAGIIRLQRGDQEFAYAVTFLAQEVPTLYADVPLAQQISSLTYEVMAARYPETAITSP